MRRAALLLLVSVACVSAGTTAGWGKGSTATTTDPLSWLILFANSSSTEQQMLLHVVGNVISQQTGLSCNIFGGVSACKPLPRDTAYLQECSGVQQQTLVDCAFFSEVTSNLYDNPVDNLEEYLNQMSPGQDVRKMCPQCFDAVKALWCAAAVPKCGTFESYTEQGVIPAVATAVRAYTSGSASSRLEAVSAIMGDIMDAALTGLPCREMCEAVTSRCSCSPSNETLGSLISWLSSKPGLKGTDLPVSYGRVLFKNLWNRPFCSIFPPSSTPGFAGRCDTVGNPGGSMTPGGYCSLPSAWCKASSNGDTMRYIQSLLLLQTLRAVTGWLTDDNAVLWGVHDALQPTAADLAAGDGSGGARHISGGQVTGIVFLSLLGAAALSVAGVAAWRWWQQKKAERVYFELSDSNHFTQF